MLSTIKDLSTLRFSKFPDLRVTRIAPIAGRRYWVHTSDAAFGAHQYNEDGTDHYPENSGRWGDLSIMTKLDPTKPIIAHGNRGTYTLDTLASYEDKVVVRRNDETGGGVPYDIIVSTITGQAIRGHNGCGMTFENVPEVVTTTVVTIHGDIVVTLTNGKLTDAHPA